MCSRCCEEISPFLANNENPSSPRSNSGGFEKADSEIKAKVLPHR
jgi:hypothetical protein